MIVGSESSKQPPTRKKKNTRLSTALGRGAAPSTGTTFLGRGLRKRMIPPIWDRMTKNPWHLATGINTGNNGLAISWLSFQRETQALGKAKLAAKTHVKRSQTLVTRRLLTSSLTRWAHTRYKWRYCGVASLLEIGAITLHVASRSPPCRERRNASLEKTRPLAPHMAFKERTTKA